jgi:hypothetical protein
MSELKGTDPSITGVDPSITAGAKSTEAQDNSKNYLISPEMRERMEDTAQQVVAVYTMVSMLRNVLGSDMTEPITLGGENSNTLEVLLQSTDAQGRWGTVRVSEFNKDGELVSGSAVNMDSRRGMTRINSVGQFTMGDDGVETIITDNEVDDVDGWIMQVVEKPQQHLSVGDVWISDKIMSVMSGAQEDDKLSEETFNTGEDALQKRMDTVGKVMGVMSDVARRILDDKLDALQQKPKREAGDVAA